MTTLTPDRIDDLVARLRRELPRGGRGRDLVTEIRDGLEDAAEAYRSAGLTAAAAEKRAIDEFGDVETVAGLCRAELGAGSAVRSAILVAIGYPLVLGCWGLFFRVFGAGVHTSGGQSAGDWFTVIGAVTAAGAIATAVLLARLSRDAARSRRALALGFAVLTVLSIGGTYVLAALTHARPDASSSEIFVRTLVQRVSLAVSAVMLGAVGSTLRHTVSSTRTQFSNRIR